MKLCVYTPLNRLAIASGVPRHIIEVVGGMLREPGLEVSFLANESEAREYLPPLGKIWECAPRISFNQPVSVMSRRWGILNQPSFESLGGSADWLYLPADAYVPVDFAKLAVTIHDVYKLERPAIGENRWDHYRARLRHWVVYRRVAKNADRILTVSKFSASRIMHHLGVSASRIHVVYNGVTGTFYEPNSSWRTVGPQIGIGEGEPYFVYAGGLKAKKNGAGIIAAWKRYEERNKHGRLVILGHHDSRLLDVAKRSLTRAVFPATLSNESLASMMASSCGLFFPSLYEGFGIPVVEAFAAGTQVVISDIPALRELAGNLAHYVDPLDPESMAVGLERCLHSECERGQRVAEGRMIAQQYTWGNVLQRVLESFG